jgi:hypothetical protein
MPSRRCGASTALPLPHWKKLGDQIISESRYRFRFKKLLPNVAFGVDEEITGPGHAFILPAGFAVQSLVRANDFGIGIGE